ncbi:transcription termination factor Rho [Eubacterium sp. F2]|uniref:transcription termination factor Rho n=1 Tax=Eubacterium sp. F2 TaxID=3381348 RepID=UPI00390801E0
MEENVKKESVNEEMVQEAAETAAAETPEPETEEKPKTRRRTTEKAAEDAEAEAEEKPKTRRRTTKKAAEDAEAEAEEKPKTRRRTTKKASEDAETEAEEKPRTRRRTTKKASEDAEAEAEEKPKARRRTTKKASEDAEAEAEEKPKTRRRTTKKAAEDTEAEAEEKPKTRRRTTKKAAEDAETEAEEKPRTRRRTTKKAAEDAEAEAEEKPKTRRRTTKKAAEDAEAEAEEKPKTRRRTTKKAAEDADAEAGTEDSSHESVQESMRIGSHTVVASGITLAASDERPEKTDNTMSIDPDKEEQNSMDRRAERRKRSVRAAARHVRRAGDGQKAEESYSSDTGSHAENSGEGLVYSSFPLNEKDPHAEPSETEHTGSHHGYAAREEGSENHEHEHREHRGQENSGEHEHQHGRREHREYSPEERPEVTGILDIVDGGFGFLRFDNFMSSDQDIYVSPTQIRRFNLKTGDEIYGISRRPGQNEKFGALLYVKTVNGDDPGTAIHRPQFESLTPIFPDERLRLEGVTNDLSVRLIDLVAPIGKGQRGMIVAPPKAGKTTLMKSIARSIEENYPDINLFVLLVDERPEEVTDMKRTLKHGQVIYSTFDEMPQHHVKAAEMMLARAKRLAEHGKDVMILLDSLTRLTRAYNLVVPASGRTLSGGIDPGAFYGPKRFFGAARNIENGGSITILATALVDTGSRMDDVIYEEFKGTGNMELHLDRKLSEKRIFPAIDIYKSGTRREELLMSQEELEAVWLMRRAMSSRSTQDVTEEVIDNLAHTRNNKDFIEIIRKVFYQEQR